MKVGIWIEEIPKTTGGGYSYHDALINLIDKYEFSSEIEIVFLFEKKLLFTSFIKNYLQIKYPIYLRLGFLFMIPFTFLFSGKTRRTLNKFVKKVTLDRYLLNMLHLNSINIIYYPHQRYCRLDNYPFIASNWDIGHLSCYGFPEFIIKGEFEYRDYWYNQEIYKAQAIFVESATGKNELLKFSRLREDKIKIIHLHSGNYIEGNKSKTKLYDRLEPFKYFFYPAQFWPHKNHYNLLLAFKIINSKFPDYKLVLTGADKGNLSYIKETIETLNLDSNVIYLGFVENGMINELYKNATALVMPTFLGPTNMPLLEARGLNCPVLCSDLNGHREQLGDGALYFDMKNQYEIASCMEQIIDNEFRINLLKKAEIEMQNSPFKHSTAIKEFEKAILDINQYRRCWKNNNTAFQKNLKKHLLKSWMKYFL
ncbi:MAG TPA: hypothetical protein DD381_03720 [Lentisphaeria bacterium]|nr:MAG: hypothetical protein A2X47_09120 [Lentisphaerae bacterium GWF2_38_69]HBM15440.1 hypothetical protein [Lentisphaeria bacterium]